MKSFQSDIYSYFVWHNLVFSILFHFIKKKYWSWLTNDFLIYKWDTTNVPVLKNIDLETPRCF